MQLAREENRQSLSSSHLDSTAWQKKDDWNILSVFSLVPPRTRSSPGLPGHLLHLDYQCGQQPCFLPQERSCKQCVWKEAPQYHTGWWVNWNRPPNTVLPFSCSRSDELTILKHVQRLKLAKLSFLQPVALRHRFFYVCRYVWRWMKFIERLDKDLKFIRCASYFAVARFFYFFCSKCKRCATWQRNAEYAHCCCQTR